MTATVTAVVEAGVDKEGCAGDPVDLNDADGGSGDAYLWDDGGAGGSFSPGNDVLAPSYSNPSPGTFTLTLTSTETATGCESSDSLEVEIHANPSADAGADKSTCIGGTINLADATPDTADTFLWDDGGAGGSGVLLFDSTAIVAGGSADGGDGGWGDEDYDILFGSSTCGGSTAATGRNDQCSRARPARNS